MKNKFVSSPEPGMGKEEADLLHLKCKTENPVEKIIRHKNNDRKTRLRG